MPIEEHEKTPYIHTQKMEKYLYGATATNTFLDACQCMPP
jgi:hypothetical protein